MSWNIGPDFEKTKAAFDAAHIVKLSRAARMAGLSFKNGALTKQAIIDRVLQNADLARATLGALESINRESTQGNSLAAMLLDALPEPAAEAPPEAPPEPAQPAPETSGLAAEVSRAHERLDKAASILRQFAGDISDMRALVTSAGQSANSALTAVTEAVREVSETTRSIGSYQERITATVAALSAEIDTIRQRSPNIYIIDGIKTPEISGQHSSFDLLLRTLAVRKIDRETRKGFRTNALLIGPASSGKTSAAVAVAEALKLEIYSQPLSLSVTDVLGFVSANGTRIETEFTRAWLNGGVLLWDELSMSQPDAVGALNAALANGFVPIPGLGTVYAHPDFYCIAGDNSDTGASAEYGARTLLDGATLDRFIRLDWQIDSAVETAMSQGHASWLACVRAIRAFITQRSIAHVGATTRATGWGAMALQTGAFSNREILEVTCKKGVLVNEWDAVTRLPEVSRFLRGE